MFRPILRLGCGVAISLALAACTSSAPAAHRPVSLAGTWSGAMTDAVSGPSIVKVVISQAGTALSGTWTMTYPDPTFNDFQTEIGNNSGELSGTIAGGTAEVTLLPARAEACQFMVTSTAGDASLRGTWTSNSACLRTDSGNLELSRQ